MGKFFLVKGTIVGIAKGGAPKQKNYTIIFYQALILFYTVHKIWGYVEIYF